MKDELESLSIKKRITEDEILNLESLTDDEIRTKSFRGADLREKSLSGRDLSGLDFTKANIAGTDFSNAILNKAVFRDSRSEFPLYWSLFVRSIVILLSLISGLMTAYSCSLILRLSHFDEIIEYMGRNGQGFVSDDFIAYFASSSPWSQLFFVASLGALILSFFQGMERTLLASLTAIISIAILIVAIFPAPTAIITSYGLLAMLGIIAGILVQAESAALSRVAEFSKGKKIGPLNLFMYAGYLVSILGLVSGVLFATEYHGLSVLIGTVLLFSVNYFVVNERDESFPVLDYLALSLLKRGPVTNFIGAQLEDTDFEKAKLKDYSTALDLEDCKGKTLNSYMKGRSKSANRLDKVLSLGFMGTFAKGKKPLVIQVIDKYMSGNNFSIDGTFYGTLNLGEIRGNVNTAINSLPDAADSPEVPGIKEKLSELKRAIDTEESLSEKMKARALQQVAVLADAVQTGDETERKFLASGAISSLKTMNASLSDVAKLAGSLKVLLPVITGFFGLAL